MELIRRFKDVGKEDVAFAGGKGASLGEMTSAFAKAMADKQAYNPIPPGFVLGAPAFDAFLKETDLGVEIDSILHSVDHKEMHTVEGASEKIQALILAATMPKDIGGEIEQQFGELGAEFVAVRSSATAEDSSTAAWAGQLESFLNTTREHLLENVKKCWASLFTPRAIFYRFEKGLHGEYVSVAVVVQKMVASEVSGIAFSVHPVTEDYNQLIIEAGYGLGEAIVSGQITPDSYVVEKSPRRILDKNISSQGRALYRAEGGERSRTTANEWRDIPKHLDDAQVLTDDQILELSELILHIESHYGFPCDIEWAREAGKFYIVQSRPITTLSKSAAEPSLAEKISNTEWQKDWGGPFGALLVSIAHGGEFLEGFNGILSGLFTTFKNGTASGWYPTKDLEALSQYLITQYGTVTGARELASILKKKSDEVMPFLSMSGEEFLEDFDAHLNMIRTYAIYQNGTKFLANYLPIDTEKQVPIILEEARRYSETFFHDTGELMGRIVATVHKDTRYSTDDLLMMTTEELRTHYEGKEVPTPEVLKARRIKCGMYLGHGSVTFLSGEELDQVEHAWFGSLDRTSLKGTSTCKGVVKGRCRVISNFKGAHIEEGEILVAGTTDPNYVPLMKKAAAIVTDGGGLLSHAAIVSRELKIPCIVGTKIATQVLKDGDMVEVDADKGVVKILQKNASDIEAKKFRFMWGQTMSAMLMEASFLSMGAEGTLMSSNIREDLQLSIGGVYANYMTDEAVNDWEINGEQYFNKDFTQKLFKDIDRFVKDFYEFSNELSIKDFSKLTNAELKTVAGRCKFFAQMGLTYFATSSPGPTAYVEKKIKDILSENVPDINLQKEYLMVLSSPNELDETMHERIDFLNLMQQGTITDADLKGYACRYPALFLNTYDDAEILDFLRSKLQEKKSSQEISEEIERINRYLAETRKQQKEILDSIDSEDLRYYSSILQRAALGRYRLKHVWSGVEYVSLSFLKELQKRIGIPFEDFIKTYLFSDIINFLDDKSTLTEEEIKKRRKCILLHYYDGKIYLVVGDTALQYKDKLIESQKPGHEGAVENIIGDIANKGLVQGRVRIVLVGDLKQFAKDSKMFRKGEVLVTTMTSPLMIPLIQKAAAIVTNEGGICSHAAVSAREFKIPCIVGTHDGTARIRTGDLVEVDANNGIIKIMQRDTQGAQPKEYKFMWGQRQSAMMTEAMLSQLLYDIDFSGKPISSNVPDDLFVLTDGVFEHYMVPSAIEHLEQNGHKMLDQKFTSMLFVNIDKHIHNFFKFCDELEDENLAELSDSELAARLATFQAYINQTFVFFETSTPSGTALLIQRMRELLTAAIKDLDKIEDYIVSLSSPSELDVTMKERLDFLDLANKKHVSDEELERHSRKYPALFFNTYNKKDVMQFLRSRREEEAHKSRSQEQKRIEAGLEEIREKHEQIYAEVQNEELEYVTKTLQKSALDRYRLKHIWSGGEYICLNLLHELQRRIGVGFEDFIKCYMFRDVLKFLKDGGALTDDELEKRRQRMVVHYFDNELHYYIGVAADDHIASLLKREQKKSTSAPSGMNGSVANRGFARGIARIVRVEDLNQFIHDSKLFQKGEVLVTTMTSPIMMPIVEKAAAIVTDEGGITSHAAIVSREFKIPCIVGTNGASAIIKTGDFIEVDANAGTIKIIESK